jgi:glyoxylate reductase
VKKNLLVATPLSKKYFDPVEEYANIFHLNELSQTDLEKVTPDVDCIIAYARWPETLNPERLSRMKRLRFIQSASAGVNMVPIKSLDKDVIVCSNAGGFSDGVAEFAWALLLSAAKRVTYFDSGLKSKTWKVVPPLEVGKEITVLNGGTLGIIGYGGIGARVAEIGKSFKMKVSGFARTRRDTEDEMFYDSQGLQKLLRDSDAVVIALPLTKYTTGMIGKEQLNLMKKHAILVNVARAEVVDKDSIYQHLVSNPEFTYATDVWWPENGKEEFYPTTPFLSLKNFIGTPHGSGPSAVIAGGPIESAVANLLKYLKGEKFENAVERTEII